MNLKQREKHVVDVLFVLLVFCFFAISALMLVSVGATIYTNIASHMESNYESRTAFSYITEKIRQGDTNGKISVTQFDGLDTLAIEQEIEDTVYVTYLYYDDGFLKELFRKKDASLSRSAGQKILEVKDLQLEAVTPSLYAFYITNKEGESITLYVHTNSNA